MSRKIDRPDTEHGPLARRIFTTSGRARAAAPAVLYRPQAPEPPVQPVPLTEPDLEPIVQAAEQLPPMPEVPVMALPAQPPNKTFKKTGWALSFVLLTGIVAGGLWVTSRGDGAPQSEVLAAQTVEEMAAITGDEKPVILYVTDKTKVQQEFLASAENGDEVRLYYQAKKAVLYRPSSDRVISVGEFTPPPAKVFIRSGTLASESMSKVENKLKNLPQFNVVSKDRSSSTKYPGSLVVDVTGRYKAEAQTLAAELGATLGSLPKGETMPEADILVIVGAR